ncbi:hypothetical protein KJ567_06125 [Candidatus Bipolaricaulota bacterium]|nr:hypothetical protein [Candidatus Bipolaricaulota bacterium]
MTWIDERSLGRTIERVEERLVAGDETLPQERVAEVVEWLLARQSTSGRRRGMFQPLADDVDSGVRLATGERLRTRLATWNVLSHEAVRLLRRLAPNDEDVQQATVRALSTFRQHCYARQHCAIGECAHSAISYLRLLASIEDPGDRVWIDAELATIRRHRLATGRWKRFPFYYTLLALLALPGGTARAELQHAVPACLRVRHRTDPPQPDLARRSDVVERVLALGERRTPGSLWDQRGRADG